MSAFTSLLHRGRELAAGRFWSAGFPVMLAVLVGAVPALLVTGRSVVLHTTDGALEAQVTDPSAPGWRAFTEPTPTALILHRNDSAALVGATLVSLTGAGAGAVVFIPVDTEVASGPGTRTLAELAAGGDEPARAAVEELLGVAPDDVVTLDAGAWRDAVARVAPLAVENPDDVFTGSSSALRFPKGRLALTAADVPDYLTARTSGESDLNRLVRHEAFWRAWLPAVARTAAPGDEEGDGGGTLARYVRAVSGARVDISTLPVRARQPGTFPDRYTPVVEQVRDLTARVVPFPVGSPGRRLRIRLLDGVGTLQHGLVAAPRLVGRGGQIDQIGNAGSFGVPRTRLEFADEARRREVESLADALGVGEVVRTTDIDRSADVVVTLGQDFRPAAGRSGG
jgi:hypothetical protein